nr:hypothetical protein [Rhodovulum kholense]
MADEPAIVLDQGVHQALHLVDIGHGRVLQIGQLALPAILGLVFRNDPRGRVLGAVEAGGLRILGPRAIERLGHARERRLGPLPADKPVVISDEQHRQRGSAHPHQQLAGRFGHIGGRALEQLLHHVFGLAVDCRAVPAAVHRDARSVIGIGGVHRRKPVGERQSPDGIIAAPDIACAKRDPARDVVGLRDQASLGAHVDR